MDKIKEHGFTIIMVVLLLGIAVGFYMFVMVPWGEAKQLQADLDTKSKELKNLASSGGHFNQSEIDALVDYKGTIRTTLSTLLGELRRHNAPLLLEPSDNYTHGRSVYSGDELDVRNLRNAYFESLRKWLGDGTVEGYFQHPEAGKQPAGLAASEAGQDIEILTSSPEPDQAGLVKTLKNFNIREKIFLDLEATNLNKLVSISVGGEVQDRGGRGGARGREEKGKKYDKIPFTIEILCQLSDVQIFLARLLNQVDEDQNEDNDMLVYLSNVDIFKYQSLVTELSGYVLLTDMASDPNAVIKTLQKNIDGQTAPPIQLKVSGYVIDYRNAFLDPEWPQMDEMTITDPWSNWTVTPEDKKTWQDFDRAGGNAK